MGKVITRKGSSQLTSGKVKFNFDVQMLNALIQYTQCEYVARSNLYNLQKLFNYTEPDLYQQEVPIYIRICTLQSILKSMIDLGLTSKDLIRSQLRQDFEPGVEVVDNLSFDKNRLNISECEYIAKFVSEKLQYIEIYQKKDSLINLLNAINSGAQLKITDPRDYNVSVRLKQDRFDKKEFQDLWNKINIKSIYEIDFDTNDLTPYSKHISKIIK